MGLQAVFTYAVSIGRFAGAAYLTPLYGVSEIAQSFCRLAAVYGAIYYLRAPLQCLSLHFSEKENEELQSTCNGIQDDTGRVLSCRTLVANGMYLPQYCTRLSLRLLRTICITSRSLISSSSESSANDRALLVLPPRSPGLENPYAIHVIQLDASTNCVPSGQYLWHLTTLATASSTILETALQALVPTQQKTAEDSDENLILWKISYESALYGQPTSDIKVPSNVILTNLLAQDIEEYAHNPLQMHLGNAAQQANNLFHTICPNEAFLPKSQTAQQAEADEAESSEAQHILETATASLQSTNKAGEIILPPLETSADLLKDSEKM